MFRAITVSGFSSSIYVLASLCIMVGLSSHFYIDRGVSGIMGSL